jgi:hypothetical protein
MKTFVQAQVNKTERNDASSITQMMRANLFRAVHVNTPASGHRRALLTARKLPQERANAFESEIRGSLRNLGLKVGVVGTASYTALGRFCLLRSPQSLDQQPRRHSTML